MKHSEQDRFQGQNEAKRLTRCTVNGLKSIQHNRGRAAILAAYLTAAIIGWLLLSAIQLGGTDFGSVFHSGLLRLLYPFAVVFILWALVAHWGMYFTGKITSDRLMRAGLVDAGVTDYGNQRGGRARPLRWAGPVPA